MQKNLTGGLMKRVIITLEFENIEEGDEPTVSDIYNYLNELIENDCLRYEIE